MYAGDTDLALNMMLSCFKSVCTTPQLCTCEIPWRVCSRMRFARGRGKTFFFVCKAELQGSDVSAHHVCDEAEVITVIALAAMGKMGKQRKAISQDRTWRGYALQRRELPRYALLHERGRVASECLYGNVFLLSGMITGNIPFSEQGVQVMRTNRSSRDSQVLEFMPKPNFRTTLKR